MSKTTEALCLGCPNPEPHIERDCPSYQVDQVIASIKQQIQRPGSRALTSSEMQSREDQRHSLASAIKLGGGAVRPEYE